MFKILRMVCAVIAAAAIVACVFLGIYLGMAAFWCAAAAALLFFALCMLFKYLQEEKEGKAEEGALSVAAREKANGAVSGASGKEKTAEDDAAGKRKNAEASGDYGEDNEPAEGEAPGEGAGGFKKSGAAGGVSGKKEAKNSKK